MTTDVSTSDSTVRRTPLVITLLVAATFVVILNETIMMNAIPRLMDDFGVDERAAQWLSTIFMLTMAAIIPITGWFLQRVTTRAAYTIAMSVFGVGTLICAAAPVFELLLVGRAVQAAGTAVMMPLLMTTLMTVVPEHDRGRVMGNVMLAMSVAPAMGPAVSGVLLQLGSWRIIFLTVLPIALLVSIASLRKLENIGETQTSSVDWASVVLAAGGFGTFVYGLSQFRAHHLLTPALIVAGGTLLIGVFVLRQLVLQRTGAPLMDLRTLKHRTFTVALLLMSASFMSFLGSMILLPMYLQDVRALSPLQTGLLVMPGGLAMGLLGPRVGRVYDKVGARPLVVPGAIGVVVALGVFARIGTETPYAVLLSAHVLLMVCLAAIFTPVFTLGLGALPPHLYPHGSSILGTLQQVAGAVGTALLVVITSTRASDLALSGLSEPEAFVGGLRWAFIAAAVIGLVVVVFAALLPAHDPESAPAHGH